VLRNDSDIAAPLVGEHQSGGEANDASPSAHTASLARSQHGRRLYVYPTTTTLVFSGCSKAMAFAILSKTGCTISTSQFSVGGELNQGSTCHVSTSTLWDCGVGGVSISAQCAGVDHFAVVWVLDQNSLMKRECKSLNHSARLGIAFSALLTGKYLRETLAWLLHMFDPKHDHILTVCLRA
jgi:hypothetical protein